MRPVAYLILGLLFKFNLAAQPPPSNLILFDLIYLGDTSIAIHSPKLLTKFNSGQYNNQPSFISDHEILFTAMLYGETQTDIYYLDLQNYYRKRITNTLESEYSPLGMQDKQYISVIRQDVDKKQELWKYALDSEGSFLNLIPKTDNIGYHCWLSDSLVALFLVGDPPTLQIADITLQRFNTFGSDIGRCLLRTQSGNLMYLHKYSENFWYLKEFDPSTKRAKIKAEVKIRSEDFTILDDGSIVMIDEGILYRLDPSHVDGWKKIQDLKAFGIHSANRMTYREGKLVMVEQNATRD